LCAATSVSAQKVNIQAKNTRQYCVQDNRQQATQIESAEKNQFEIRRIEFKGNMYIRDREFRKRFAANFGPGEIFTRKGLDETLKNISRMKRIRLELA
jgi:outer membrane protein assembly factor BamA